MAAFILLINLIVSVWVWAHKAGCCSKPGRSLFHDIRPVFAGCLNPERKWSRFHTGEETGHNSRKAGPCQHCSRHKLSFLGCKWDQLTGFCKHELFLTQTILTPEPNDSRPIKRGTLFISRVTESDSWKCLQNQTFFFFFHWVWNISWRSTMWCTDLHTSVVTLLLMTEKNNN